MSIEISKELRDSIISTLAAGLVPSIGAHLIQVGRLEEFKSFEPPLERLQHGGCFFKLVIGNFGSGKTYFLNIIKERALKNGSVVMSADLSAQKQLIAKDGKAKRLYFDLIKSISTQNQPNGNALTDVLDNFMEKSAINNSLIANLDVIAATCSWGFDFANIIDKYITASKENNYELRRKCIMWLSAGYNTKSECKENLRVSSIIDDSNIYEALKLLATLIQFTDYKGLLLLLDEMVNLYHIQHSQSRKQNYEQILYMLNDCLQGTFKGLGIVITGTTDFVYDNRKGLFSYEALSTRLAKGRFDKSGFIDVNSPVLELQPLIPEEFLQLIKNIQDVYVMYENEKKYLNEDDLVLYVKHCHSQIGDETFRTPRKTIKEFINLLTNLENNRNSSLTDYLKGISLKEETVEMLDE